MGHSINTRSFNVKKHTKDNIITACNQEAICESDNHGNLHSSIKFEDNNIFESYDEAMSYLDKMTSRSSYYQGAVKYKKYESSAENRSSAKYRKLADKEYEKGAQLVTSMKEYVDKHAKKNAKSLFCSCPKCQSRINKDYIEVRRRNNYDDITNKLPNSHSHYDFENSDITYYEPCPVCGQNLMSDTTNKYINNLHEKIIDCVISLNQNKTLEEEAKKSNKYEVFWLVRYEYHV